MVESDIVKLSERVHAQASERERERERQTDRQTDRQTETQTERVRHTHTHRLT